MYAFLIDGFNLAYRSFFGMPALKRLDGFPTQALHGWVRTVWKLLDTQAADRVAVFFDLGGCQARLSLLPEYKAQRAEMPEALKVQLPELKRLCRFLGHTVVEQRGVEADDLLAAAACQLVSQGYQVGIVSSDKDFAQLLSDARIVQWVPPVQGKIEWQQWNAQTVKERFGVAPEQMVDYLALMGDSSDNIAGLSGVGPKTAATWLATFGSLESILENHHRIQPERFQKALLESHAILKRNQDLLALKTHLDWGKFEDKPFEIAALQAFFKEMEMSRTALMAQRRYDRPLHAQIDLFNKANGNPY